MLSTETIDAFVKTADTRMLADTLVDHQLLGTDVGDRVLACVGNDAARFSALRRSLQRRNAWDIAG